MKSVYESMEELLVMRIQNYLCQRFPVLPGCRCQRSLSSRCRRHEHARGSYDPTAFLHAPVTFHITRFSDRFVP